GGGREQFRDVTTHFTGHKLAMVVAGRVWSAPVINGPIRDGRASITMNGDLDVQERDAAELAAALRVVPLPSGGTIESQVWHPPASIARLLTIVRCAISLLGGVLVGLVIGIV